MREGIGTSIAWLSQYGDDGHGIAEYSLRLFIVGLAEKIPIGNHFYVQTMFMVDFYRNRYPTVEGGAGMIVEGKEHSCVSVESKDRILNQYN